jgi:hypothetical protein
MCDDITEKLLEFESGSKGEEDLLADNENITQIFEIESLSEINDQISIDWVLAQA